MLQTLSLRRTLLTLETEKLTEKKQNGARRERAAHAM